MVFEFMSGILTNQTKLQPSISGASLPIGEPSTMIFGVSYAL